MTVLYPGDGRTGILIHESWSWAEVLSASGELDIAIVPPVGPAVDKLLRGNLPVVVDLSGCSYLDSTILRVLVGAANAGPNRFAILIPPGAAVRRVFQIAGLDRVLQIHESREDLQRYFSTKSPEATQPQTQV